MTSVAILLYSSSSKTLGSSNDGANVVVWTSTPQSGRVGHNSVDLVYYQYYDHSHQFQHTNALVQRLGLDARSVVHVASASPKSTRPEAAHRTDATTTRLLRVVQESMHASMQASRTLHAEDEDEEAASLSSSMDDAAKVVQHHDAYSSPKLGAMDLTRLSSVMQELLTSHGTNEQATAHGTDTLTASPAWLQLTGDVSWHRHPELAAGLCFFLHTASQWPVVSLASPLHIATIGQGHLDSVMSLDSVAADAIHLWPPATVGQACSTGGTLANNSVYGVLRAACTTGAGQRRLHAWLRQPLVQLPAIVARHDAVEHLVTESVGRDAVRSVGLRLFASTDVSKLARTLASYQTNDTNDTNETSGNARRALVALYDLYLVSSQKIPLLTEQLELALASHAAAAPTGVLHDILATLVQCRSDLERSVDLVEQVLDLEKAPREFLVQADYKEELRDILPELNQVQAELEDHHAEMNELWAETSGSSSTVRLEATSEDGAWQFRLLDTNDSKILQNQLADVVTVHRVLKNGVYFTTKALRSLSCKRDELRAEYDKHSRTVALDAASVAASYGAVLERASDAVSHLDVLVALAHTAAYSPHGYCRPVMTDSDEDGHGIQLTAARHPCVELQDSIDFIPNNVELLFGESSFLLVTGPNMGGKSTYIRALGAIVTMAQIGSFVPCTSAKINICHHILARVGAGDLQERGISTFMAEMLESSSILRTATKRSLIIIDELGRGTSTFDGYGLARAISEYIVQKIGCMTVFATHFHELTVLEDQEPAVKNCHVTAQKGVHGLTFLYEIKPGPCLESFGIQVAEMANVPAEVIQDAKRRARALENFEYRKKTRSSPPENDAPDATAEEMAAMAFVNRFRRLAKDALFKENAADSEERTELLRLLEA